MCKESQEICLSRLVLLHGGNLKINIHTRYNIVTVIILKIGDQTIAP